MKRIALFCFLTLLLMGCAAPEKRGKTLVSVSLVPQKYFLEQIAGDDFDINIVIPPGSSHSEYDPSPGNMVDISKSAAYLCMGNLGFEEHLIGRIADINPELKIYDLSKDVVLLDASPHSHEHHHHSGCSHNDKDAHIWMSARNAKTIAKNIYRTVSELNPERESFYKGNLEDFLARLDSLDMLTQQRLQDLSVRSFIIFHPALTYYAGDYSLEQIPMEIDGKEPSVTWMSKVVTLAKERNVKLIFAQSEYSQASAQAIAEAADIELETINPLSENWWDEFQHITNIIAEKMK